MSQRLRVLREEMSGDGPGGLSDNSVARSHAALDSLLRRHLPTQTASMFAEPVPSADGRFLEWYADLQGQPVPLGSLSQIERGQVRTLLNERLAAVRSLADRLDSQGDRNAATMLRQAAVDPHERQVYCVNGQPVLVGWGRGAVPAEIPAQAMPAVLPNRAGSWLRWVLLGLALLVLLALLFFGFRSCDLGPQTEVPKRVADDEKPADDGAALRAEMAALEQQLADRLAACPAPETPLRNDTPLLAPPSPAEPTLPTTPSPIGDGTVGKATGPQPKVLPATQPEPDALANRKEENATAPLEPPPLPRPDPQPQFQTHQPQPPLPSEPQPQPAKEDCAAGRKPWEAPEVVILLDGSGSMRLPAGVSQQQVTDLIRRARVGDRTAIAELRRLEEESVGQSRLDFARQAVRGAVSALPSDVDVGLVAFGECKGVENYNFFRPSERDRLNSVIESIQPRDGTPLARSLERAANMVDGTQVPGILVVVSDGEDSCGGDPCAAARAIKARKPMVRINVIDVNGDGGGACLAEATGGKVYQPSSVADMEALMMRASEQVPGRCGP